MSTSGSRKDYELQKNYGITSREYDAMFKAQGGSCWICGNPPRTKALAVDHEHQPKESRIKKKGEMEKIRVKVRGLLCWACNMGLKYFRDNSDNLTRAAKYLRERPAQKVLTKVVS